MTKQPTSRTLFDFECSNCLNRFEELVYRDVIRVECPECKADALRQISAPRLDPRMALDGGFPTAISKWERTRRHHHLKGSSGED